MVGELYPKDLDSEDYFANAHVTTVTSTHNTHNDLLCFLSPHSVQCVEFRNLSIPVSVVIYIHERGPLMFLSSFPHTR